MIISFVHVKIIGLSVYQCLIGQFVFGIQIGDQYVLIPYVEIPSRNYEMV